MSEDIGLSVRTLRDLVSEEAWAGLIGYVSWTYGANRTLLRQGSQGTHVLALTDGMVKVVHSDRDGRQRLLAFRGPGEILGEMALQSGGTRLADVRTISTCKASLIPAEDFRRFVRDHHLAPPLAALATSRLREQTAAHDGAVHERLAAALLRLVEISGGTRRFSVTRDELAQHVGVGRNSVTKALKHLGPGLVEASKNRVDVISAEGLRKVLVRSIGA